jgi:type I restriction enzyme M protein
MRGDLDDFVTCYDPANRHERTETERFKAFSYDELVARDTASLDIFWLRDESLEDTGNLPAPELIAAEIVGTCRPHGTSSPRLQHLLERRTPTAG